MKVLFALLVVIALALAQSCPAGTCPSTDTCCDGPTSGSYGCCPYANATCCSDHQHCCPSEYPVCDTAAGECKAAGFSGKSVPMFNAHKPQKQLADACPAGTCPSTDTCCDGPSAGSYGCCPYANATCCSDHQHCCPSEYPVCDTAAGECKAAGINGKSIPMFMNKPRVLKADACPAGTCPSTDTCCDGATAGSYGCCPYANATCCSDHQHCCPSEYPVCDTAAGECKAAGINGKSIPMFTNKPKVLKADACPAGTCPSTDTCCDGATAGSYGCCPYANATCCSDHQHCCPSEYPVCDTAAGECKAAGFSHKSIPMFRNKF